MLAGVFEQVKGAADRWHFVNAEHTVSATTNALGTDTLIVFSSTAAGQGWKIYEGGRAKAPSYDKFSAHVFITTGRHDQAARVEVARGLRPTDQTRDSPAAPPPGVDPEAGEVIRLHLPDDFYAARPVLAHVSKAVRARQRSRDAVLHVVLARVAAAVPHVIKIPAIVGSPRRTRIRGHARPAGSGKGDAAPSGPNSSRRRSRSRPTPHRLGRRPGRGAVRLRHRGRQRQAGQGQAPGPAQRLRQHRRGRRTDPARHPSGSTLLSTLRSIWSGKTIGNTNAARENRRIVPAGSTHSGHRRPTGHARPAPSSTTSTPAHHKGSAGPTPSTPNSPTDPPMARVPRLAPTRRASSTASVPSEAGKAPPTRSGSTGPSPTRSSPRPRPRQRRGPRDPWEAHSALLRLRIAALPGHPRGQAPGHPEDWELAGTVKATSDNVRPHAQNAVGAEAHPRNARPPTGSHRRHATPTAPGGGASSTAPSESPTRSTANPTAGPSVTLRRISAGGAKCSTTPSPRQVRAGSIERTEPGQGTDKRTIMPGERRPEGDMT